MESTLQRRNVFRRSMPQQPNCLLKVQQVWQAKETFTC
jgi:hypothetical protein